MRKGAAFVHGDIAYIIGRKSHTIYSYHLDEDKWTEYCQCPYTNPGLAIINGLLTAVGGKEGDRLTNKVMSWNHREWLEVIPPMHTPRRGPALMYYDTYLIAVGGNHKETGVEILNIPSLFWTKVTSLPRPLDLCTVTQCYDDIIAMDVHGRAYKTNVDSLISLVQSKASSTEHSQWMPPSKCPVYATGPTVTTFYGHTLAVSNDGIFQLCEKQWMWIGDLPVPVYDSIVCVVCDKMVVVGGCTLLFTSTDAVRVAVTS